MRLQTVNDIYHKVLYGFRYDNNIRLLKNFNVIQWIQGDLSFLKNIKDESQWGKQVTEYPKTHWTHLFGEELSKELYYINGVNTYKPHMKKRLLPDLESDNCIIEVKTQMYKNKNGSISEKILGTPFKYANVPILYNKPLYILCIGGVEEVYRNKYKLIGNDMYQEDNRKVLFDTYKKMGISYIGARDLLNNIKNRLL
jgi:hypothetical protein